MDPQRPRLMYGCYYYGQEAIIRNDDANIQLRRTETSGHIRNVQPIDSYGSRRMQAISLGNVGPSHNNAVLASSIGNFEGYGSVNNSSSLSGRYEQTGVRYNNGLSNDRDDGFECNRQNYHVNGSQQPNLFGSERQRPVSIAGDFDLQRQPTDSFDFARQPPGSFEARSQNGIFGSNNIDFEDARRSNSSWDRENIYDRQPSRTYGFGRRQPDSFEDGEKPILSFEDRSQSDPHNVFVNDVNSDNERSKLIMRIKKLYDEETIKKNSERFDEQSWVKVSYLLSGGLKTYVAQMTCPVCLGSLSPYNRETEPGRIPKWDLFAVKRHVATLHPKKGVATETVAEEKTEETAELAEEDDDPAKIEPIVEEVELSEDDELPKENKKMSSAKTVQRTPLKKAKSKGKPSSPVDEEVESSEVEETVPKKKTKTLLAKTHASLKKAKSKGKSSSPVDEVESSEEEETVPKKKPKPPLAKTRASLRKAKSKGKSLSPVDKDESSKVDKTVPKEKQKASSAKTRAPLKKAKSKGKSTNPVDKDESSELEETVPKKKQKTSSAKTRASLKKAKSKESSRCSSTDSSEISEDSTIYSTSESDLETKSTGKFEDALK